MCSESAVSPLQLRIGDCRVRGMIDFVLRIIRNTQTVWAEYKAVGFSSIKSRCFVRFKVDGFNLCYLLCLCSTQIFHNSLSYHYHYRHFVTNVGYRDKGRAPAYSGLSPLMSLSGQSLSERGGLLLFSVLQDNTVFCPWPEPPHC